jgi:hypothetical protein
VEAGAWAVRRLNASAAMVEVGVDTLGRGFHVLLLVLPKQPPLAPVVLVERRKPPMPQTGTRELLEVLRHSGPMRVLEEVLVVSVASMQQRQLQSLPLAGLALRPGDWEEDPELIPPQLADFHLLRPVRILQFKVLPHLPCLVGEVAQVVAPVAASTAAT